MTGFQITTLHAWTQVDEQGEEGIIAKLGADGLWLPLIGADEDRIRSLRPWAQATADATGRPVQLRRFAAGEVVEHLAPAGETIDADPTPPHGIERPVTP